MLLGLNNLVNRIRKGYEKVEKWKIDHPNAVGKVPNPFFYFNGFDYINHWDNKDFIKKSFVSSYGSKFADKLLSCKTQIEVANLLLKKRLAPNYAEK